MPERLARAGSLVVLGAILLATWPPFGGVDSSLHQLFGPLCHQMPERSPALFGAVLPVCHRCLGFWVGIALVAHFWRSPRLGDARAWPLLLGLGGLDFALSQAGLVADVGVERVVSGLCLGVALPLLGRALFRAARRVRVQAPRRALR